jgi:hypothetical protein
VVDVRSATDVEVGARLSVGSVIFLGSVDIVNVLGKRSTVNVHVEYQAHILNESIVMTSYGGLSSRNQPIRGVLSRFESASGGSFFHHRTTPRAEKDTLQADGFKQTSYTQEWDTWPCTLYIRHATLRLLHISDEATLMRDAAPTQVHASITHSYHTLESSVCRHMLTSSSVSAGKQRGSCIGC